MEISFLTRKNLLNYQYHSLNFYFILFYPLNDKNIAVRTGSKHFNIICIKNMGFQFPSSMLRAPSRQITIVE